MTTKIVPYNTGKVKIGSRLSIDTRPSLSAYDERLQSALLYKPSSVVERFLDAHPRLAPVAVFAALVLVLLIVGTIENL